MQPGYTFYRVPVVEQREKVPVLQKDCQRVVNFLPNHPLNSSDLPEHLLLLKLCVFCLGLLQDEELGVGIFPQYEEVFVGSACLDGVARQ